MNRKLHKGAYLTYDSSKGSLIDYIKSAYPEKQLVDYAISGLDRLYAIFEKGGKKELIMYVICKKGATAINPMGVMKLYPYPEATLTRQVINHFKDCPVEIIEQLDEPSGNNAKQFRDLCYKAAQEKQNESFKQAGEVIYLKETAPAYFNDNKERSVFMVGDPQALLQFCLDGTRIQVERKKMVHFSKALVGEISDEHDLTFLYSLINKNAELAVTKFTYRKRREFRLVYIKNSSAPYYQNVLFTTSNPLFFSVIEDWAETHNKENGFGKAVNTPELEMAELTQAFVDDKAIDKNQKVSLIKSA